MALASGATADDLSLMLWEMGDDALFRLTLIEDEHRLSR